MIHTTLTATPDRLSEGLPVPREPGYGSTRSHDGEAPRTCRERRAGCPTRTSGDGAWAAPSERTGVARAFLVVTLMAAGFLAIPARAHPWHHHHEDDHHSEPEELKQTAAPTSTPFRLIAAAKPAATTTDITDAFAAFEKRGDI